MKIKRLKVENFKSYKKINITLNNLNFIIGGNATGKSNFVNILKFFNDIIEFGIDDAILLQGGIKYLFNSNSRKDSYILLNIEVDLFEEQERIARIYPVEKRLYLPYGFEYSIKIKPNARGDGYRVIKEKMNIIFNGFEKEKEQLKKVDNLNLNISKDADGKIIDNLNKNIDDSDELITLNYLIKLMKNNGLLLNNFFSSFGIIYRYNSKIKIYNFDVNLLKSPSTIVARSELEEDGANLVNIIQQLLKNRSKKEKLNKIIKMVLPFIDDIKIENNVNKSVFFKVKESYNKNEFPSYMLSDGTVNILAVIVALYFQEDNEVIVLEEPEKNVHPKLLSTIVSILEDVSLKKQIFITTHNPYIIKEANLNDILLVSRNETGISTISKPANDEKIKRFLENDLGIEDLFVDGILK